MIEFAEELLQMFVTRVNRSVKHGGKVGYREGASLHHVSPLAPVVLG